MSSSYKQAISRRNFLKLSGTAAAAAAVARPSRVLYALLSGKEEGADMAAHEMFSACDMCFNKCGLIARVENGVIKKLDPNPKSLKSRGMLCARGNAGVKQLYDPDRLKYPLLRKGERGEGKWQRLTWDQALDHAAEQMQRIAEVYTRCGFLFMAGTDMQSTFVHRFAEAYGSYNVISHESNCLLSRNRAFLDTFGVVPTPDVLNSKYIIMPGANRFEALVTPDSMDLMTAMQGGCKLVVLDPRYTKTAGLADEYYTSSTAYNDFYSSDYEPSEPNITAMKDSENIKWKHLLSENIELPTPWEKEEFDKTDFAWQNERERLNNVTYNLQRTGASPTEVDKSRKDYDEYSSDREKEVQSYLSKSKYAGKVGAFEGAGYVPKGLYRSSINCIMFSRTDFFCPICQEAMVGIIEWYSK